MSVDEQGAQIVSVRMRIREAMFYALQNGYLRCGSCGGLHFPTDAEIQQYLHSGWPRCCGQVMTFAAQPQKPGEA